jgi:hypothetical protein
MAKKPQPGTRSNAPSRFGPGSKKDIEYRESLVAGGGRMRSATKKRNTTVTKDEETKKAGEARAKNIEGHEEMTARAKRELEKERKAARRRKLYPSSPN